MQQLHLYSYNRLLINYNHFLYCELHRYIKNMSFKGSISWNFSKNVCPWSCWLRRHGVLITMYLVYESFSELGTRQPTYIRLRTNLFSLYYSTAFRTRMHAFTISPTGWGGGLRQGSRYKILLILLLPVPVPTGTSNIIWFVVRCYNFSWKLYDFVCKTVL